MGRETRTAAVEQRPTTVFLDTNVLLNFVHTGFEVDHSSTLFDDGLPAVVIGVTVSEELAEIQGRRAHIYPDFLDFVLEEDGRIEEYDPTSRRPYFQANDYRHIESLQMELSQLGSRAEVQRRLRRFVRTLERRLEYLLAEVIPDALFDQQPGLTLVFALQDVIDNDADVRVVADAALWAAEGDDSSGVFLTADKADLLGIHDDINAAITEARDDSWTLSILHPSVINDLPAATTHPE